MPLPHVLWPSKIGHLQGAGLPCSNADPMRLHLVDWVAASMEECGCHRDCKVVSIYDSWEILRGWNEKPRTRGLLQPFLLVVLNFTCIWSTLALRRDCWETANQSFHSSSVVSESSTARAGPLQRGVLQRCWICLQRLPSQSQFMVLARSTCFFKSSNIHSKKTLVCQLPQTIYQKGVQQVNGLVLPYKLC